MHSEFRLEKKHKNEILYRHYDLFRRKERKKEIQLIVYTSFNKKKVSTTEY